MSMTSNDMSYMDVSAITFSDMDSMGGGMGGFNGIGKNAGWFRFGSPLR